MKFLGKQILIELQGCNADILNDVPTIEQAMRKAAEIAGATIVNSTFHHFSPFGVSGVVVIKESHLAIHTWPEYSYAAVDIFTCGETLQPWKAYEFLQQAFQANECHTKEIQRGNIDSLKKKNDFMLHKG